MLETEAWWGSPVISLRSINGFSNLATPNTYLMQHECASENFNCEQAF